MKKEKKDKKKIFDNVELESGFKCLPKEIPIYMNYGNHDYETGLDVDGTKEEECLLLKREIELVNNLNTEGYNINLQMHNKFKFSEKTLVILLDTTIYDMGDIDKSIKCYSIIDSKYNVSSEDQIPSIVGLIKQDQSTFISNTLSEEMSNIINGTIKNIVIVGHHPIIDYKEKAENVRIDNLPEIAKTIYDEIYKPIYPNNQNVNYYYMCADLHQYQTGEVEINSTNDQSIPPIRIRQYIIGTGGANKDDYNPNKIREYIKTKETSVIDETIQINYIMTEEDLSKSRSENGFLICQENVNGLTCQFRNIAGEYYGGLKKRKNNITHKRNEKTKKRKKNMTYKKNKKTNKKRRHTKRHK